jgi:hypothetical protein
MCFMSYSNMSCKLCLNYVINHVKDIQWESISPWLKFLLGTTHTNKMTTTRKPTPWSESASELYQPSNHRFSAKLVPTFTDRGCHMVSAMDPYSRILGFLDCSHYFFFQVAPQLYSRDWVDPGPGPLLLKKSGRAGICSLELFHRGGLN